MDSQAHTTHGTETLWNRLVWLTAPLSAFVKLPLASKLLDKIAVHEFSNVG
jgi:hypothetical protein